MTTVAINADTADIPAVNFAQQGSDPAAPAAGRWFLYFKSGGLYARSEAGGVIGPFKVSGLDSLTVREVDTSPSVAATILELPNGTLSDQGGGVARYTPEAPPAAGAATQIGTVTVGVGGAATISFTAIPGTYNHLWLMVLLRGDTAANTTGVFLNFNDDGGANYDYEGLTASHTTVTGGAVIGTATPVLMTMAAANGTAGKAHYGHVNILFYANTTFHKEVQSLYSATFNETQANIGLGTRCNVWRNTAAITKIVLTPQAGNFAEGSQAILYGVT